MPPWLPACLGRTKDGRESPQEDAADPLSPLSARTPPDDHDANTPPPAALGTVLADLPPAYQPARGTCFRPSTRMPAFEATPPTPPLHRLHLGDGANGSVSSLRRAVLSVHCREDDEQKPPDIEVLSSSIIRPADTPQLPSHAPLSSLAVLAPTPPRVIIDHLAHPHIFEAILSYLPLEAYASIRATSTTLTSYASSKMYSHVWIRPLSVRGEVDFLFPDTTPPRRVPGLMWNIDASHVDMDLTFSRLQKYTRVVDMNLREAAVTPILWKHAWAKLELQAALSRVKVLRRLDQQQGHSTNQGLQWNEQPPRVLSFIVDYQTTDMRFDTEMTFLHLYCGSRRSELLSKLPIRISRAGIKNTVLVIYLHSGCPEICGLPVPFTVAKEVSNLVILLLPPPKCHSTTSTATATPHRASSLGILGVLLRGTLLGQRRWGEYTERRTITIGPMEFLSNADLHLDLDETVTLEERNDIIYQKIATALQPLPIGHRFAQTISLLSLEEMKKKIGMEAWDCAMVSPEALVPAASE